MQNHPLRLDLGNSDENPIALLLASSIASVSQAQSPTLNLDTAVGEVEQVEGQILRVRYKSSTSRSGRLMSLKIVGTSKINTLIRRVTDGKLVLSQRELAIKSLKKGQSIAIVFTRIGSQPILLNGVVKPIKKTSTTKKTTKKSTRRKTKKSTRKK